MRTFLILALLAPAALAAQPPADPIPLRPGGFDLSRLDGGRPGASVMSPGGIVTNSTAVETLRAVDGREVRGGSRERALLGPVGSSATLAVEVDGALKEVRLTRGDVFAPAAGFTEVVTSPRFVVHHRPGGERGARALAEEAERLYARSGLPRDTRGRRAHLWAVESMRELYRRKEARGVTPDPWGAWVSLDPVEVEPRNSVPQVFGYLAFGFPGRLASEELGVIQGWSRSAEELHRGAARAILETRGLQMDPSRAARMVVTDASMREYVRARFGDARLAALWITDEAFETAVPRALGIPAEQLAREWEAHVRSLGPRADAVPGGGTVAVTLGWGAVILLLTAHAARRREVG